MAGFKLTYATMYNPPEELHANFDASLRKFKASLGKEQAMIINGKDVFAEEKFNDHTPIDTNVVLAVMQKGNEKHAEQALSAARNAFPGWSHTPWQERVKILRQAADLIDERLTELGVVMAMEVGKNRMESMGDVAETADLIRYSCDMVEQNDGFVKPMGKDPLPNHDATNISVLRPYGVWLVVSPFNFPFALTGGPAGAALAAGNTIVMKPATDTPFIVRLLADCLRDAGLPDGVMNFVTGPGRTIGAALVNSPEVDGVTFTGSYDVGMKMFRDYANGKWVRPMVLELGGKNPAIVTKNANLDDAAQGIVRSAFGLQGQKCSAASRVYIQNEVYDQLIEKLKELTEKLSIGDPTDRKVFLGPVVNKSSYQDFQDFCSEIGKAGKFLTGGKVMTDGELGKGYFCAPTFATDIPYSHRLWKHEMFLPITTIGKFTTLEEAMVLANDVDYGLTAGMYGTEEEAEFFFDKIEAGVTYANRPQGATTGAWPGFQPFGGWKGSGSSGKNAGGYHYVQLYMHEQIRTLIRAKK
jgi:1-pyrroline-5-carboxylate dehydrogenase